MPVTPITIAIPIAAITIPSPVPTPSAWVSCSLTDVVSDNTVMRIVVSIFVNVSPTKSVVNAGCLLPRVLSAVIVVRMAVLDANSRRYTLDCVSNDTVTEAA